MELMTKYQYTYFIYPYVIDSKKYNKHLLKLLKNKKCKLRIFERERDMHLYNYFLPNIRESMFWSFGLDKSQLKSFNTLDVNMQANLLAKHDCNVFHYELPQELQGKVGERNGIFFEISEIKTICYRSGICFLIFKTGLQQDGNFSDILNFNYKFREINSKTYHLKEYENIKIQSDTFKDVQEISDIIKEIAGNNTYHKKMNIENEKFMIYSYACLDQNLWNENIEDESIKNVFYKYCNALPASIQVTDMREENKERELYENKYARYGFSSLGTVLLTSDMNPANYTVLAQKYESEYLYTYILSLYKKFLLKRLNYEFNKTERFKSTENEFLNFTKHLWIQEITNDDFGKSLIKKWDSILETEELFVKLKSKYEVLYKKYNIETSNKNSKRVLLVVSIMIVINMIGILVMLLK